eukprot:CAMPEP_0172477098 /NCGR_PEP_ID=MMETSP1065-20121228/70717_1 /TAXON_ID=265537 /ORGANISM="Amphiprora paludosa, Strain CCMP125" /LENGTH=921 /DNA_ID=CAMNT_0013235337 /DNA_START=421 /DNA_END=3186 /DNA_ORIENTATION=-
MKTRGKRTLSADEAEDSSVRPTRQRRSTTDKETAETDNKRSKSTDAPPPASKDTVEEVSRSMPTRRKSTRKASMSETELTSGDEKVSETEKRSKEASKKSENTQPNQMGARRRSSRRATDAGQVDEDSTKQIEEEEPGDKKIVSMDEPAGESIQPKAEPESKAPPKKEEAETWAASSKNEDHKEAPPRKRTRTSIKEEALTNGESAREPNHSKKDPETTAAVSTKNEPANFPAAVKVEDSSAQESDSPEALAAAGSQHTLVKKEAPGNEKTKLEEKHSLPTSSQHTLVKKEAPGNEKTKLEEKHSLPTSTACQAKENTMEMKEVPAVKQEQETKPPATAATQLQLPSVAPISSEATTQLPVNSGAPDAKIKGDTVSLNQPTDSAVPAAPSQPQKPVVYQKGDLRPILAKETRTVKEMGQALEKEHPDPGQKRSVQKRDVISGQGGNQQNEHYLETIRNNAIAFRESDLDTKRKMAYRIALDIVAAGGCFLDKDELTLTAKDAFTRVMRSLKDGRRAAEKSAGIVSDPPVRSPNRQASKKDESAKPRRALDIPMEDPFAELDPSAIEQRERILEKCRHTTLEELKEEMERLNPNSEEVRSIQKADVIAGRGQKAIQQNKHFLDMVRANSAIYRTITTENGEKDLKEKRKMAYCIALEVISIGGCFVAGDGKPLPPKQAVQRVMAALRDWRNKPREEGGVNDPSNTGDYDAWGAHVGNESDEFMPTGSEVPDFTKSALHGETKSLEELRLELDALHPQPDYVRNIQIGDVVSGRGEMANRQNQHYLELIRINAPLYRLIDTGDPAEDLVQKRKMAYCIALRIARQGCCFVGKDDKPLSPKQAFQRVIASLKDWGKKKGRSSTPQNQQDDDDAHLDDGYDDVLYGEAVNPMDHPANYANFSANPMVQPDHIADLVNTVEDIIEI